MQRSGQMARFHRRRAKRDAISHNPLWDDLKTDDEDASASGVDSDLGDGTNDNVRNGKRKREEKKKSKKSKKSKKKKKKKKKKIKMI